MGEIDVKKCEIYSDMNIRFLNQNSKNSPHISQNTLFFSISAFSFVLKIEILFRQPLDDFY